MCQLLNATLQPMKDKNRNNILLKGIQIFRQILCEESQSGVTPIIVAFNSL